MRRTLRGRGARGFTEAYVEPFPGSDTGGAHADFSAGCVKLWREGYAVRYEPPKSSPLLSLMYRPEVDSQ